MQGCLLYNKGPGLESVPSLPTVQHSTVQAPKHPASLRSTDALCMQCLWACACQGLQWGTVSSHHCVGAGERPRAPAKGPHHIGREWVIHTWGPTDPSLPPPAMLALPKAQQNVSANKKVLSHKAVEVLNCVPLRAGFYLAGTCLGAVLFLSLT